jgi:thiol-disulfide isomerase/thioredoxin
MKNAILFTVALILVAPTLSVAQNDNARDYFSVKDSSRISGKVVGFIPGQDDFISFSTYSITGDNVKHAVQLKNDGSFNFAFYQAHSCNITINYKDAFKDALIQPAEELNLTIYNNKLDTNNYNAFVAGGKLAEINNLIFDFQSEFLRHKFDNHANLGDKSQPDSVFARKRDEQLNEELNFLNTYIRDKRISNTAFKKWQKNQLTYLAAKEIVLFPFFGKLNKQITETQLLGFIQKIPVNDVDALANSAYYDFLKDLVLDEEIIININPAYDSIRKSNGYNSVPLYLDKLNNISNGLTTQILYYDLYHFLYKADDADKVIGRFESTITNVYIKQLLANNIKAAADGFKFYDVVNRLKKLNVTDSLKQKFIAWFENQRGTNVFVDFWADWCGPCMMEMPDYAKLIAAFDGKPLKFVFFSINTSDRSMMEVKNKNKINADFINLSKDEVAVMNNIFEFHSYPQHFVINKSGQVISNSTRGQNDINKLLFP